MLLAGASATAFLLAQRPRMTPFLALHRTESFAFLCGCLVSSLSVEVLWEQFGRLIFYAPIFAALVMFRRRLKELPLVALGVWRMARGQRVDDSRAAAYVPGNVGNVARRAEMEGHSMHAAPQKFKGQ